MSINPILLAVPFFFALIGVEVWIAHRRAHAIYRLNDAIGSLALGSFSQITGLFTKFATLGIYGLAYDHLALTHWPQDWAPAWVAALVFYDFCYYWLHRMGHEINVLWAAHVVHHSSEDYNLSTALRQTSSGFLFGWIFYLPMAIAGVPPLMFVIVGLIDLLYQFWIHTKEINSLGWFDRVFASPSNHRVHHGQNDYCIDRNYGGVLILWDRLFGTFVDERPDEPIIYGIRGALRSFDPIEANLSVYRKLWAEMAQRDSRWAKLSLWLERPSAALTRLSTPFDSGSFRLFDPAIDGTRRWMGFSEFLGLLALTLIILAISASAPTGLLMNSAALALLKGFGLGRLLNGNTIPRWPVLGLNVVLASLLYFQSESFWPLSLVIIAHATWLALMRPTAPPRSPV